MHGCVCFRAQLCVGHEEQCVNSSVDKLLSDLSGTQVAENCNVKLFASKRLMTQRICPISLQKVSKGMCGILDPGLFIVEVIEEELGTFVKPSS